MRRHAWFALAMLFAGAGIYQGATGGDWWHPTIVALLCGVMMELASWVRI